MKEQTYEITVRLIGNNSLYYYGPYIAILHTIQLRENEPSSTEDAIRLYIENISRVGCWYGDILIPPHRILETTYKSVEKQKNKKESELCQITH
jgi:hypothetical protein